MKLRLTKSAIFCGILLVFGFLAFTQGCAYYNTFYNAKKEFEAGERTRKNAAAGQSHDVKNYEKCIETGSRLLELYPKSRWVDDCLLLMGKSYYRSGKLPKAQRKFEELISNFPGSKLVPEARLWLAETLIEMKRSEEAILILGQLSASPESKNLVARASFLLGTIHFDTTRYRDAADAFRIAAQRYRTKLERAESFYMLGRSLFMIRDFQEAKAAFDQIPKLNPSRELIYKALLESGRCMAELGDTEAALRLLDGLRKDVRYQNYSVGIELTLAKIQANQGNFEKAARIYLDYLEANPTGAEKADAYFYIGVIYRDHYRDLALAAAYFDSVQNAGGSKVFADSARAQAEMLKRGLAHINKWMDIEWKLQYMDSLLKSASSTQGNQLVVPPVPPADSSAQDSGQVRLGGQAGEDTTAAGSTIHEAMPDSLTRVTQLPTLDELHQAKRDLQGVFFQLGEFFLHDLQDQDSASYFFEWAAYDTMDHRIRWKANLVLADLAQGRGADSLLIRSYYEAALATPGITVDAENRARKALGLPLKEMPRDTLRENYLKLEGSILDTTASPDSILISLNSLMIADTSSIYFLKSLWARGYFYEHRVGNRDSARAAYERIISLYPDSAFTTVLAQRLDTTTLAALAEQNVPAAAPAEADTIHTGQEAGWPPPEESLLGRGGR